jgi:hypothetical protein
MVVDLTAFDCGNPFVEEIDELAHEPGLRLSPLSEHDDVVPCEDAALEGRYDGVPVADYRRKELAASTQPFEEVGPELILDAAVRIPRAAELAERLLSRHPSQLMPRRGRGRRRGAREVSLHGAADPHATEPCGSLQGGIGAAFRERERWQGAAPAGARDLHRFRGIGFARSHAASALA